MSFCDVVGCPGMGYPYQVVIETSEGVRTLTLCTHHRKELELHPPEGVEVLSVEKRDPGVRYMGNPYRSEVVATWPDPPPPLSCRRP